MLIRICSLQVFVGRFLLAVGRFLLVVGRFRLFRVLLSQLLWWYENLSKLEVNIINFVYHADLIKLIWLCEWLFRYVV